jgi:hypothetical protein
MDYAPGSGIGIACLCCCVQSTGSLALDETKNKMR